jgi:hypothetical protein
MKTNYIVIFLFAVAAVTAHPPPTCGPGEVRCDLACCAGCKEGRCCQPCGSACCTAEAPCIAPGVCCAPNRHHCTTNGKTVCCSAGNVCTAEGCCPESEVVDGHCCSLSSQICQCVTGTPSRCYENGYQSCVKNKWVYTECKFPTVCLPFPVAGAGVSCVGPPGS